MKIKQGDALGGRHEEVGHDDDEGGPFAVQATQSEGVQGQGGQRQPADLQPEQQARVGPEGVQRQNQHENRLDMDAPA